MNSENKKTTSEHGSYYAEAQKATENIIQELSSISEECKLSVDSLAEFFTRRYRIGERFIRNRISLELRTRFQDLEIKDGFIQKRKEDDAVSGEKK